MDIWSDNFVWIAACTALVGWIVAGLAWSNNFSRTRNLFVCFFGSFMALSLIGWIAAIASHISSIGPKRVYQALSSDWFGGSAYFFEVGFETAALWGPAVLAKLVVEVVRDNKRTDA